MATMRDLIDNSAELDDDDENDDSFDEDTGEVKSKKKRLPRDMDLDDSSDEEDDDDDEEAARQVWLLRAALPKPGQMTDTIFRLEKVLSSTRMMTRRRNTANAAETKNATVANESKKRSWTRKITTLSVKQILNSQAAKLLHR